MLLSIIIPVYNSEKYVRHTLQSVYGQVFDENQIEVIVINDGTPDKSMDIVHEFAAKHDSLRIFEQENQGLSAARNAGLNIAQGKYVWFVDSDDWIEDGFLARALQLLQDRNDDVFLFRIRELSEDTGEVLLERQLCSDTLVVETDLQQMLLQNVDFSPMQVYVIRREFLEQNKLRFVQGIIHEDMEFAPRMLVLANKISSVPIFHYNYLRRTSGSLTSSPENRKNRVVSLLQILDLHNRLLQNNDTPLSRRNQKAIRTIQFWLFRKIFNFVEYNEYKEWDAELLLSKLASHMKPLVFKHLFFRSTSLMFLHRLMFLISPSRLKARHKGSGPCF